MRWLKAVEQVDWKPFLEDKFYDDSVCLTVTAAFRDFFFFESQVRTQTRERAHVKTQVFAQLTSGGEFIRMYIKYID